MEEQQFLKAGTCLVTSSRIEIDGQTFAVRNIGSVKVTSKNRPWAAILLGLFGIGAFKTNEIFGSCLLVLAAYVGWKTLAERKLILVSGGGEVVALTSTKGAQVEALRAAIAQAISAR